MLDRLIRTLVETENEAADDLLLQALRLGAENEQRVVLGALVRRKTSRGLTGVVLQYDDLPESLQRSILRDLGPFHHALAECGRSDDSSVRLAALRLIAIGRQGKLAYVISENLQNPDADLSKAATEALVALARWVATETRKLQAGAGCSGPVAETDESANPQSPDSQGEGEEGSQISLISDNDHSEDSDPSETATTYANLMTQRPEIETAVGRALTVHRGSHVQDLLRAALLLADWPGSKTLAILNTAKHSGQTAMVRRLQQPPESEHVSAFLLGASHGQLRSHFGSVFSHIEQAPVLDALLRKTHWLKDNGLAVCMHLVNRGTWWSLSDLPRDLTRRGPADAGAIAEWIAVSGLHDVEQDERMQALLSRINAEPDANAVQCVSARLRLLRLAIRRRRGSSVSLIRSLLSDPDERIMRMAAREIVRRKPADFENILLKLMTTATPSVRRVIGRAIGHAGFENYWQRFDKLDRSTRKQAGKAMLKLLPDAIARLQRRAVAGSPEQRVKALQMVHELGIAPMMQEALVQLCADSNPRIRSKAVTALGEIPAAPSDLLVERLLNDSDARVRANAVEVLEARGDPQFVPVLAQRAMAATGRERANAIKAMHRMKVGVAGSALLNMLRDERPEHRISALWALRQIGWWQLLNEVGNLAKGDGNVRVRRYAVGVLKTVSELVKEQKKAAG
jgi:HEAT repeat protein